MHLILLRQLTDHLMTINSKEKLFFLLLYVVNCNWHVILTTLYVFACLSFDSACLLPLNTYQIRKIFTLDPSDQIHVCHNFECLPIRVFCWSGVLSLEIEKSVFHVFVIFSIIRWCLTVCLLLWTCHGTFLVF